MKEGEKYLMVPKEHPLIEKYSAMLDELSLHSKKDVCIDVRPSTIEEGDIGFMTAMLTAAQHKKKWIETLLFNVTFRFYREEYSESEYLTLEEWSGSAAYQKWFQTINQRLPFSLFFFKSEDARLFSLQGDFLQEILQNAAEEKNSKLKVEVPAEKIDLINNRLFMSCVTFYTYCSGMHVDAKEYIDAIIAEQRGIFEFKHVHRDWLKNQYKMVPQLK